MERNPKDPTKAIPESPDPEKEEVKEGPKEEVDGRKEEANKEKPPLREDTITT